YREIRGDDQVMEQRQSERTISAHSPQKTVSLAVSKSYGRTGVAYVNHHRGDAEQFAAKPPVHQLNSVVVRIYRHYFRTVFRRDDAVVAGVAPQVQNALRLYGLQKILHDRFLCGFARFVISTSRRVSRPRTARPIPLGQSGHLLAEPLQTRNLDLVVRVRTFQQLAPGTVLSIRNALQHERQGHVQYRSRPKTFENPESSGDIFNGSAAQAGEEI